MDVDEDGAQEQLEEVIVEGEGGSESDAAENDEDGMVKVKDDTPKPGCCHYERHCAFLTPCCQKIYVCRRCHDEKESHELDRHSVQEVQCLECKTIQEVGRECVNCGQLFGKYFCEICRMYDDMDRKQFHCDACGICRIGGRENFFHCVKCDMCLGKNLEGSHKCVEKVAHSGCPVCLEDLHSSTASVDVLPCGHMAHKECYRNMLRNGIYTCPLCGVSTTEMKDLWKHLDEEIEATLMPEDYRNVKVWILCKDCQLTSETTYHVLGLKCHGCGSYNTCNTKPKRADDLKSAAAAAAGADSAASSAAADPTAAGADPAAASAATGPAAAGAHSTAAAETADSVYAAVSVNSATAGRDSTAARPVGTGSAVDVASTAAAAARDDPDIGASADSAAQFIPAAAVNEHAAVTGAAADREPAAASSTGIAAAAGTAAVRENAANTGAAGAVVTAHDGAATASDASNTASTSNADNADDRITTNNISPIPTWVNAS